MSIENTGNSDLLSKFNLKNKTFNYDSNIINNILKKNYNNDISSNFNNQLSNTSILKRNLDIINSNNKLNSRKRVKIYNQISNEKRAKIIKLVIEENKLLKEAASILKINYSTAKTIMRIFRKEKRILRKSDKTSKIFSITKPIRNKTLTNNNLDKLSSNFENNKLSDVKLSENLNNQKIKNSFIAKKSLSYNSNKAKLIDNQNQLIESFLNENVKNYNITAFQPYKSRDDLSKNAINNNSKYYCNESNILEINKFISNLDYNLLSNNNKFNIPSIECLDFDINKFNNILNIVNIISNNPYETNKNNKINIDNNNNLDKTLNSNSFITSNNEFSGQTDSNIITDNRLNFINNCNDIINIISESISSSNCIKSSCMSQVNLQSQLICNLFDIISKIE